MTPSTASGTIASSSCLKCEKVFSMVDQLKESMADFEIFTMELQFDPKSAKSKSQQVISNFWQLILNIQSLKTIGQEVEAAKDSCTNLTQSSTRIADSVEQAEAQSLFEGLDKEYEPAESESKSESESNPVDKINKITSQEQPKRYLRRKQKPPVILERLNELSKPNPNFKPYPNPNRTPKRLNELKRSKTLLRTIECETRRGFYNLFECLKCQRQFNYKHSGIRHVQTVHMRLGTRCPYCGIIFFNEPSLELHIPKCKRDQFKTNKVSLKVRKKLVQLPLYPHEKHQQEEQQHTLFPGNGNQNPNKNPGEKVKRQRGRPRKAFDPLKIKVGNPFENFSLEKTMNVKVVTRRLNLENPM